MKYTFKFEYSGIYEVTAQSLSNAILYFNYSIEDGDIAVDKDNIILNSISSDDGLAALYSQCDKCKKIIEQCTPFKLTQGNEVIFTKTLCQGCVNLL